MAGGYKNGVGGRGAEPIGLYGSVSKVGSSLKKVHWRFQVEPLMDTFEGLSVGSSSEYVSRKLLKSFFPFKNHALISFLIYQSRRRGSSVASTLDAVRETTVLGDRQVSYTITDSYAALLLYLFLYFAILQPPTEVWSTHSQICAS